MCHGRTVKELVELVDGEGDVRPCKGAVLQGTHNVVVKRRIREGVPVRDNEAFSKGAGRWIRLGSLHVDAMEQIHNIFGLIEMKMLIVAVNMISKEVRESTEVFELEFCLQA
jgi:hypothetical protein